MDFEESGDGATESYFIAGADYELFVVANPQDGFGR